MKIISGVHGWGRQRSIFGRTAVCSQQGTRGEEKGPVICAGDYQSAWIAGRNAGLILV